VKTENREPKIAGALLFTALLWAMTFPATGAVQVQDLSRLKGSESSKLVGMGLVVGLKGTGDGGKFQPAMRPLAAMMQRLVDPNVVAAELANVKNVAIVSITAKVPAGGVREGDPIDVQVASVGAASSLKDGRLFLTPLYGPIPGSPIFAFAEGRVEIEQDQTPTVGTIKAGATLTQNVASRNLDKHGRITLVLDQPNATWPMANTIATMVNDVMAPDSPPIAMAVDQKNIVIQVPGRERANPAPFIAQVMEIQLDPTLVRTESRVVINQRTGTIVMTGDVEISPVVISHAGLTITTITPQTPPTPDAPRVEREDFVALDPDDRGGAKLADLLAAFNQLKVSADDRIAIVKEIHRTGKLHAKLVLED
jgi:flagellar P-ring protein precursor FlgI